MTKRALCIGINDYPDSFNDLAGCVADANDWAELLSTQYDFKDNVSLLLDEQATRSGILTGLGELVDAAGAGDVLVFSYSGHGTWVPDRGEHDEIDNRDEAICAHDGNIIDDELRGILVRLDPEARLTVVSDSCHSGGVTRAQLGRDPKRA